MEISWLGIRHSVIGRRQFWVGNSATGIVRRVMGVVADIRVAGWGRPFRGARSLILLTARTWNYSQRGDQRLPNHECGHRRWDPVGRSIGVGTPRQHYLPGCVSAVIGWCQRSGHKGPTDPRPRSPPLSKQRCLVDRNEFQTQISFRFDMNSYAWMAIPST